MDAKIQCDDCGCKSAIVETIEVFMDHPDHTLWDIQILCHCPACSHFGRLSLKALAQSIFNTQQDSQASVPTTIQQAEVVGESHD